MVVVSKTYLAVEEAAKVLDLSSAQVYNLINSGILKKKVLHKNGNVSGRKQLHIELSSVRREVAYRFGASG